MAFRAVFSLFAALVTLAFALVVGLLFIRPAAALDSAEPFEICERDGSAPIAERVVAEASTLSGAA
ncbi:MAG: hypothetical protein AAFW46_13890 [Pseudomonadota bacterium]